MEESASHGHTYRIFPDAFTADHDWGRMVHGQEGDDGRAHQHPDLQNDRERVQSHVDDLQRGQLRGADSLEHDRFSGADRHRHVRHPDRGGHDPDPSVREAARPEKDFPDDVRLL